MPPRLWLLLSLFWHSRAENLVLDSTVNALHNNLAVAREQAVQKSHRATCAMMVPTSYVRPKIINKKVS